MNRPTLRICLALLVAAAALLVVNVDKAEAGWWHHAYGYTWHARVHCCTPVYTDCCYTCPTRVCYRPAWGCCRSWCRPYRTCWRPWRCCRTSWCGCGCLGCSGCCTTGTYVVGSGCDCTGTTVTEPSQPTPAEPTPAEPPVESEVLRRSGSAVLTVNVPTDARVFVNDTATTTPGAARQYISRGLAADSQYTYQVRAEVTRQGRTVQSTKTIQLAAGQAGALDFAFDEQVSTTLTLDVPADAKVYLAGQSTAVEGTTRAYTTDQLAAGQQWTDYTVRVELEREGRHVTREQSITLTGGQSRSLSFQFDEPQVAVAAK